MIKILYIILLSLYSAHAFAGFGGNIGQHDDRRYGSLSDPKYRGVAKLTVSKGRCTGGFISKDLVLTNDHCAIECKNGCMAEFYNGSGYEKSNLKIVSFKENYNVIDGSDWAILRSDKENPFYQTISTKSTVGPINRGGFGALRIIEDSEIPYLKALYQEVYDKYKKECAKGKDFDIACINKHVETRLKAEGRKPLLDDSNNFKVQDCNILGNHPKSDKMITTDCDSAGGDSGAPYLRNGRIVGLNNSGPQNIFNDNEIQGSSGVKTENFYGYAKYLIDKENKNTINENPVKPSEPEPQKPVEPVTVTTNPTQEQNWEQLLEQRLKDFDCD